MKGAELAFLSISSLVFGDRNFPAFIPLHRTDDSERNLALLIFIFVIMTKKPHSALAGFRIRTDRKASISVLTMSLCFAGILCKIKHTRVFSVSANEHLNEIAAKLSLFRSFLIILAFSWKVVWKLWGTCCDHFHCHIKRLMLKELDFSQLSSLCPIL